MLTALTFTGQNPMEKQALILRARAELAKLNSIYAAREAERTRLLEQAGEYEHKAKYLESVLEGWSRATPTTPAALIRERPARTLRHS
jgi:hypothetical protein